MSSRDDIVDLGVDIGDQMMMAGLLPVAVTHTDPSHLMLRTIPIPNSQTAPSPKSNDFLDLRLIEDRAESISTMQQELRQHRQNLANFMGEAFVKRYD